MGELLAAIEARDLREGYDALDDVPAWLAAALRRGLAEEPDDRFGSMAELIEALRSEETEDGGSSGGGVGSWRGRSGFLHGLLLGLSGFAGFAVVLLVLFVQMTRPSVGELVPELTVAEPAETRSAADVAVRLIGEGRYEEAQTVWEAEESRRKAEGEPVVEPALAIAQAYLERAKTLIETSPKLSGKLAGLAVEAASTASTELWEEGLPRTHAEKVRGEALALQQRAKAAKD